MILNLLALVFASLIIQVFSEKILNDAQIQGLDYRSKNALNNPAFATTTAPFDRRNPGKIWSWTFKDSANANTNPGKSGSEFYLEKNQYEDDIDSFSDDSDESASGFKKSNFDKLPNTFTNERKIRSPTQNANIMNRKYGSLESVYDSDEYESFEPYYDFSQSYENSQYYDGSEEYNVPPYLRSSTTIPQYQYPLYSTQRPIPKMNSQFSQFSIPPMAMASQTSQFTMRNPTSEKFPQFQTNPSLIHSIPHSTVELPSSKMTSQISPSSTTKLTPISHPVTEKPTTMQKIPQYPSLVEKSTSTPNTVSSNPQPTVKSPSVHTGTVSQLQPSSAEKSTPVISSSTSQLTTETPTPKINPQSSSPPTENLTSVNASPISESSTKMPTQTISDSHIMSARSLPLHDRSLPI